MIVNEEWKAWADGSQTVKRGYYEFSLTPLNKTPGWTWKWQRADASDGGGVSFTHIASGWCETCEAGRDLCERIVEELERTGRGGNP